MQPRQRASTPIALGLALRVAAGASAAVASGCSDDPPPAPPACDAKCRDGTALRALREVLKLVFNLTLQGKPVGAHDQTIPCIRGGKARIYGTAVANEIQGATEVHLTYELESCAYVQKDTEPNENYDMTLTGKVVQDGTFAVQPTATTAVLMKSDAVTFTGTVYDPPLPFEVAGCALDLAQNGSHVGGSMCGRQAGFDF